MTRSRFLALVLAVLALVLVAPLALLFLAGSEAPPVADPSVSASDQPIVGAPVRVEEIAWVYAPPPAAGGPTETYVLQAGTLGAEAPLLDLEIDWIADLGADLARQPAVDGPVAGTVVYVADDGAASMVQRAPIGVGGRGDVMAELEEVVWDMVVAPDGSAAYAAIVERGNTEHDLGVVRILLDGSAEVEPLMQPAQLAASDGVTEVAFISFNVELAVSPDGRHLVRRACSGSDGCLVEILDLANGLTRSLRDADVLGVAAGALMMSRCGVDGCGVEAMELDTGGTFPIDAEPIGRLVAVGDTPVFVSESHEEEMRTTITALDLATGATRMLYRTAAGTHASLDLHLHLAMAIPQGFVHLTESVPIGEEGAVLKVRQRELLLSITDGRAIEIPAVPFRPPPAFDRQG